MFMNQWFVAAIWVGLAFAASLISIRTAISVALVEILVGVAAGNFLHIPSTEWTTFLAGFGSILLTFMAGAEVEPQVLRRYLKESLAIGSLSFLRVKNGHRRPAWPSTCVDACERRLRSVGATSD